MCMYACMYVYAYIYISCMIIRFGIGMLQGLTGRNTACNMVVLICKDYYVLFPASFSDPHSIPLRSNTMGNDAPWC